MTRAPLAPAIAAVPVLAAAALLVPVPPAPAAATPPGSAPRTAQELIPALRREVVRLHRRVHRHAVRRALPPPAPLTLARRPDALRRQVLRTRALERVVLRRGRATPTTLASAYSAGDAGSTQGCPGAPRLHDSARSVATFLIPCGARMRVCYRDRCVVVVRRDSGPYVGGRGIDLNIGVVRALGLDSIWSWGVREVRWRAVD